MSKRGPIRHCPRCSREVAAEATLCAQCGYELEASADTAAEPATGSPADPGADVNQGTTQPPVSRFKLPKPTTATAWAVLVIGTVLAVAGYLLLFSGGRREGLVRTLSSAAESLTTVVFSADGRRVAAGSASGKVILWDLASGERRMLDSADPRPILSLAVVPGGVLLAGGVARSLLAWKSDDPRPGEQRSKLAGFPAPITALAVHPRRAEIAVGLANGSLYVLGKAKAASVDVKHTGSVKIVRYDPREELLVSGGSDGRLVWRDAQTRQVHAETDAHSSELSGLAFSPDGGMLATGCWNGEIKIWNTQTQQLQSQVTQPDAVAGMEWLGSIVVTGSWDGVLRFWSPSAQESEAQIPTGGVIHALAISPHGRTVATVSRHGSVQVWSVPDRVR